MIAKIRKLIRNYHSSKTLSAVASILKEDAISLIDVGAAGDIQGRWKQVLPKLDFIGFEPDERSTINEEVQSRAHSCKIIREALWNKCGTLKINLCRKPQVSSYFEPNSALMGQFPSSSRFDIVGVAEVTVKTLDSMNLARADCIKIDVQGGEIFVLEGATKTLEKTFAVELEVEFVEIYKHQPLFGNICKFLTGNGFDFLDFTHISRWERNRFAQLGQAIFADALFIKVPSKVLLDFDQERIGENEIRRYCAILSIFIRPDLIEIVKSHIMQKHPDKSDLLKDIMNLSISNRKKLKKIEMFNYFAERILSLLGNTFSNHTIY